MGKVINLKLTQCEMISQVAVLTLTMVQNPAVRCDWRFVWRLAELKVVRRKPPPRGSRNLFTADILTGVPININDAPFHSGLTRTVWQWANMNHTRSPETEAATWNSAITPLFFLWRIAGKTNMAWNGFFHFPGCSEWTVLTRTSGCFVCVCVCVKWQTLLHRLICVC